MISLAHVLIALLGVVAGIIFGAIPGMTATMAVAVFLPMTYAYDLNTVSVTWSLCRRYLRWTGSGNPDQHSGYPVFHHHHLRWLPDGKTRRR